MAIMHVSTQGPSSSSELVVTLLLHAHLGLYSCRDKRLSVKKLEQRVSLVARSESSISPQRLDPLPRKVCHAYRYDMQNRQEFV
jgi:hypothetical protein